MCRIERKKKVYFSKSTGFTDDPKLDIDLVLCCIKVLDLWVFRQYTNKNLRKISLFLSVSVSIAVENTFQYQSHSWMLCFMNWTFTMRHIPQLKWNGLWLNIPLQRCFQLFKHFVMSVEQVINRPKPGPKHINSHLSFSLNSSSSRWILCMKCFIPLPNRTRSTIYEPCHEHLRKWNYFRTPVPILSIYWIVCCKIFSNIPVVLRKVVLNEADFMQEKVENWVRLSIHVIRIEYNVKTMKQLYLKPTRKLLCSE